MALNREVILYGVATTAGAVGLGAGIYLLGRRWMRMRQLEVGQEGRGVISVLLFLGNM